MQSDGLNKDFQKNKQQQKKKTIKHQQKANNNKRKRSDYSVGTLQ